MRPRPLAPADSQPGLCTARSRTEALPAQKFDQPCRSVSPDPVFGSDAAGIEGDVVVEITIDETGTIVQKVVVQSLGPSIDARVLGALEKWHFTPASKNSVPIPSKQDVYYHFPR